VSPQRSNRVQLVEGTLRCLERLPPERITAREIARESGANLASITYHFGTKEDLVTEAVIVGLDRWLEEIAAALGDLETLPPAERFRRAGEGLDTTTRRHGGLARTFLWALARAQHDERVRELLAAGFRRSRSEVAQLLGLGAEDGGTDAGGLVLAIFNGLLFQSLTDPALAIDGRRREVAFARLREVLPSGPGRAARGDR
jgi:AcrR family transcriptional regulator